MPTRIIRAAQLIAFLAFLPGLVSVRLSAQTPRQKVEDQILATRVRLALANDAQLRPFNFEISASDGVLVLEGRVETQEQGARAVAIAERLSGAANVESRLTLLDGSSPEYGFEDVLYVLDPSEVDSLDPMMALEMEMIDAEADPSESETEDSTAVVPEEPQVIYKVPEGYHLVEEGDTLLRISQQYDISIRQLRALNDLSIATRPEPGELLRITAEE